MVRGSNSLRVVGVLGSPRTRSNTEVLLDRVLDRLEVEGFSCVKVRLREYVVKPCYSCRKCLESGCCCIDDDMTRRIIPLLLEAHVIVVASPVNFDNVSTLTKIFMDRTWCIRGRLKNKVLGSIVVGRGYGLDSALTCIHNWGLKHRMIIGDRGVMGIAFDYGEILSDTRAFRDAEKHALRLAELALLVRSSGLA